MKYNRPISTKSGEALGKLKKTQRLFFFSV
jgi:hypothetical protein